MRGQQGSIFRTRAGKKHGQRERRIDAAPQFVVDKVTQTACTEPEGDQRRDKIRHLEEAALGASGEDNHHHNHAN